MVLFVLRVSDRRQLYQGGRPGGERPPDAPVKNWGVETPLEGSGFEGCAGAP